MKIKFTKNFPFGKFIVIPLFGTMYCKDKGKYSKNNILNHPNIYFDIVTHKLTHWYQQKEMGIIFFFIWYIIEWIFKIFTGAPYFNLSFEREARTVTRETLISYTVIAHYIDKKGNNKSANIFKNGKVLPYNIGEIKKCISTLKCIEYIPISDFNKIRSHFDWIKRILR